MSAHSISEDLSRRTLRSTRRRSQASGSNADTVNKPSGGNAHRLPSKGSAWRKLQYVSGNSGLTSKTFITTPIWTTAITNIVRQGAENVDFFRSCWEAIP